MGARLSWLGRPNCLGPSIFAFLGRTSGKTICDFRMSSFSSLCSILVVLSFMDARLSMLVALFLITLSLLDFKGHMVSRECIRWSWMVSGWTGWPFGDMVRL